MLGMETLSGNRFLDIGSGNGLFSLAARRLGASVNSFDYDPDSVVCTRELRRRFFAEDLDWRVEEGSALDAGYMKALGTFDIVYSWGVLHHTGDMWRAMDLARRAVVPSGTLFIALYNDKGAESEWWHDVKQRYNSSPQPLRLPYALAVQIPREIKFFHRTVSEGNPGKYVRTWTQYHTRRGMSRWHDLIDWIGGYPYEYATPGAVVEFYRERGFALRKLKCSPGTGCNEFVLQRVRDPMPSRSHESEGSSHAPAKYVGDDHPEAAVPSVESADLDPGGTSRTSGSSAA